MRKSSTKAPAKSAAKRGRRPDPERSRTKILDAAYDLFAENSFSATTITDISEAAGVAKGLVLFHFKSKEGVFIEVVRRVIPTLSASLDAINAADERSASELFADAIRQVYKNMVLRPHARKILRLLVAEGRRLPKLRAYYHSEVAARGHAVLNKIVEIGVSRGEFSIEFSENVSQVLIGPLVAALVWNLLFGDIKSLDIESLCELHIKMALQGLLDRGTSHRDSPRRT
jgi:AcrR family transcriptional regulator